MPTRIMPTPIRLSRGDSNSVDTIKAPATNTNTIGTKGYPSVLYGRTKSGRFRRNTSTEAVAMP